MKLGRIGWLVAVLLGCFSLQAQQSGPQNVMADDVSTPGASPQLAATVVPRLMRFSGVLTDTTQEAVAGNAALTFSLYQFPEGGTPLWSETQTVLADDQGHYTLLLGASSPQGLPLDLFTSGAARWLGVAAQLPDVGVQPRVLLVGVPYALKAADADTLGGKPASAFVTTVPADTSSSTLESAGTASPAGAAAPLVVGGTGITTTSRSGSMGPTWVTRPSSRSGVTSA